MRPCFFLFTLYRGCARYCFGCGATSHEARQCTEQGFTKEKLGKVVSVVGEEETGEAPQPGLHLSYAAVLKDPSFLARQKREHEEKAQEAREQEVQEREKKSARREKERQEQISKDGEAEGLERARQESKAKARLERKERREDTQLGQEQKGAEAQVEQEQDAEQAKEQERGGGEQPLTREQQMEKTVVRDRADSLRRK